MRVLLIYLGISWPILGVAGTLQDVLLLPDWVSPTTLVVLLVGLVVVLTTAWIQSSPLLEKLAAVVPESWLTSWHEVAGDLRVGRIPELTRGRSLAAVFFLVWLVFGFAGVYVVATGGPEDPPLTAAGEEAGASLAVMPFAAIGVDSQVYGDGIVSLLSTTLDGVGGVRAIDGHTVLARWDEAVEADAAPELATVLEVGRAAGARYILLGSAVEAGSVVRLVAELYDGDTGERLESVEVRGRADSVLAVVDRLSVAAARALIAEVGGGAPSVQHLDGLLTGSPSALQAYLDGERHYRRGRFVQALESYERAVQLDSTFALASLRASVIYGWEGGLASEADRRGHLERAARHAERLPPRERALLDASGSARQDAAGAIERGQRLTRFYPDDADLWEALGETYIHHGPRALEPRAKGIEALRSAVELEPYHAPYYIHVVEYAISRGDSAEAARWLARERELAAGEVFTTAHHRAFTLAFGDSAARAAVLDTIRSEPTLPGYFNHALQGPRRLAALKAALDAVLVNSTEPRLLRLHGATLINRGKLPRDPITRVVASVQGLIEPPDLATLDAFDYPLISALAAAVGGLTPAFHERERRLRRMEEAVRERNPVQAESLGALRRLIIGLATVKEGRLEEALPLLERSLDEVHEEHFVSMALYLIGDVHETLGRYRLALDHYHAATDMAYSSLGLLRAARLHERLGELEEARALYQDLLVAWQDADPFFDPWLEEARRSLPDA